MKTRSIPLLILLLGACSANATPSEEAELDSIYTSAKLSIRQTSGSSIRLSFYFGEIEGSRSKIV
jgi:hypothetical protein